LNDGRLTLRDWQKMRLDLDPFPANVNVIDFEGKKVLVHPKKAETTKGKRVVMSDDPRVRMLKPHNLEPGGVEN
jgi:hypothetical protein